MARSFFNSKLWQGILSRIGVLETQSGTLPPPVDYNTIADIRAETTHVDEDRIFCLENQVTYQFDSASTVADDGFAVIKPTDIGSGDPGRWLMEYQLALKTHTHAEKANIVSAPTQTRFLVSDENGNPVESASAASSFAAASHTHAGYATTQSVEDLEAEIDAIDVDGKMDKYAVTEGDIGKPAVFDANGNTIPGSAIQFHEYSTGALTAKTTKSCVHNKNFGVGYFINARSSDNQTNAIVSILKPTAADPQNSIDIQVPVDIPAPGLIIQIIGA